MVHLFVHLVLSANHKDGKWQGVDIKRGQLVTGRKRLKQETGLSEQTIRTGLTRLKSTNEITIKPTSRFSLITVCNYDSYNSDDFSNNQPTPQELTNNQPASNQQVTTNKNVKKEKNDKKYKQSDFSLAQKYWQSVKNNPRTPKQDEPNFNVWADDIRKLREIDNHTEQQILAVMNWSQSDDFWCRQCLAPSSFRKKKDGVMRFDMLAARMKKDLPPKETVAVCFVCRERAKCQIRTGAGQHAICEGCAALLWAAPPFKTRNGKTIPKTRLELGQLEKMILDQKAAKCG